MHTDTASALLDLAACHANLGDAVSSARAHAEVLSIRRSLHGEAHPDSIRAANTLGVLLYKRGAFGEALPLFSSALRGRVQMLGHTHPDVASSCVDVANCMLNSGDAAGGLVWQVCACMCVCVC